MTVKIKIFISYSRRDKDRIDRLYHALSQDDEFEVFLDAHDIAAAEDWRARLENLIRAADCVIFTVSTASTSSDICQWEIEQATTQNKRILPVILENVSDADVPDEIARLNYIFLRDDTEFKPALGAIGEALKVDIDWVREHTRLAELAYRWELATQLGAQPLRGKELDRAEKWLSSHPKDAPPPTEQQGRYIYQSRRSAARRQRIAFAGSLVVLATVSTLAIWAVLQRNVAVASQEKAVLALEVSNESANKMALDMIDGFKRLSVPIEVRSLMLENVVDLLEGLNEGFENPSLTRRSTWVVNQIQSEHAAELGRYEDALAFADTSLKLSQAGLDTQPETAQLLADKAASLMTKSTIFQSLGQNENAQQANAQGILVARRSLDLDPDSRRVANALLGAYSQRAFLGLYKTNSHAVAQDMDAAMVMARNLFERHPDNKETQETMLALLGNMAEWKAERNDLDAVYALQDEREAISRRLLENDPNNTSLQAALAGSLIGKQRRKLQNGEAVIPAHIGEAVTIYLGLIRMDPDNLGWRSSLGVAIEALGGYFEKQGKHEDALSWFERAVTNVREQDKMSPGENEYRRNLAVSLDDVARIYFKLDRLDDALAATIESVQISRALSEADPMNTQLQSDVAISLHWLGEINTKLGQRDAAFAAHSESVEILRKATKQAPDDVRMLGAFASELLSVATLTVQNADFPVAGKLLIERADAYGQMTLLNAGNTQWASSRTTALTNAAAVFSMGQAHLRSLQIMEGVIAEKRVLFAGDSEGQNRVKELSSALGSSAWYALLAGEFKKAKVASNEAIQLDPEALWLQTNLAHALLLSGEMEIATALYLSNKGKVTGEGKSWTDMIKGDFDALAKAGFAVPEMEIILSELSK